MNLAQHILVLGLRLYRWVISPAKTFLFGPFSQCRFTPSCSAYALEAIIRHGALVGSGYALKRICRCHPWGGCGEDPVPPIGEGPFAGSARLAGRLEQALPFTEPSNSSGSGLSQNALRPRART